MQHRCAEDCELCRCARILQRAARACETLAAWLPDPQRANLLVAHLWGLLSAQSCAWRHPASRIARRRWHGCTEAPKFAGATGICRNRHRLADAGAGYPQSARRRDSSAPVTTIQSQAWQQAHGRRR
ncbi:hypothetical protein ACTMU2_05855 [Cupriavidus basilensis]